ncbi:MAG: hypothetical protein DRP45_08615 [Candidatus Zixiibacteriota bacterium]|nr:MAG: hypothetical protein DRP45_08615 [candidate division Zixibacteria bacterium]
MTTTYGKPSIQRAALASAQPNPDPEELIAEGRFRRDLYYRLNVIEI